MHCWRFTIIQQQLINKKTNNTALIWTHSPLGPRPTWRINHKARRRQPVDLESRSESPNLRNFPDWSQLCPCLAAVRASLSNEEQASMGR